MKSENIINKVTTYRINWYNHVIRIENTRYAYKAMHYKPGGRRNIGRLKKHWREQFSSRF